MIPTRIKYIFPTDLTKGKVMEEKSPKELEKTFRKTKLLENRLNPTMKPTRERSSEIPENHDSL